MIRLEAQVTRCKSALENTEQVEDKLKVDNRKLQREVRTTQTVDSVWTKPSPAQHQPNYGAGGLTPHRVLILRIHNLSSSHAH